jgi:branched-chain amino acid transport system ATP-binding protein
MTLPAIIRTNNVCKQFGGLQAVSGVSLEIPAGAITGLIGANGAGKTTLFNIIAGLHKPTSGHIFFDGYRYYRTGAA